MSPQVTAAVIAASVGVLTVIATVAVQISGRRATSRDTQEALEEQRKQLDRTLAEQRTRTLNERFATAAGQLGDDKQAAVRLAGVYAMAGLADDWPENRQTCVDVLCAYLRLPYERDPGEELEPEHLAFLASREVRWTVIQVIAAHLREAATVSWQGLEFDFNHVTFDGGDFRGAVFSRGSVAVFDGAEFSGGMVRFHDAKFSGGHVYFGGAKFSGGRIRFDRAEFSGGTVSFRDTRLSGGTVDFKHSKFSGGTVLFHGSEFSGGEVLFNDAVFSGAEVRFDRAEFSGGTVSFRDTRLSGGTVDFDGAKFSGAEVLFEKTAFTGAEVLFKNAVFSGGTLGFDHATFRYGEVSFDGAKFAGGTVSFGGAKFAGGTVSFRHAGDWSFPPVFPWTGTPPPGVVLPEEEDQSQA